MNDIFNNPTHVARLGYNGFDMEQKVDFTAAPCMLLPIYYDIALFGDKMRLQCNLKLRTQPLEAASEFNADVRLDWFAVPIRLLYKFFPDQYFNIQDFGTNFVNIDNYTKTDVLPVINMSDTLESIMINYPDNSQLMPGTVYPFYHYLIQEDSADVGTMITWRNDAFRLMDALGIPVSEFNGTIPYLPTVSAFIPAAYQKIYYDFYRLTDREVNDPSFYNLDAAINGREIPVSQALKMFRLHYAPWKKDFFTNVFPSPLQGQGSIDSFGSQVLQFNNWLSGGNDNIVTARPSSFTVWPNGGAVSPETVKPTTVRFVAGAQSNINAAAVSGIFNPANIRGMFAVEKALEITRRSAKHYDAQTLAHWGVKLPESLSGECMYLGSQTQPFIVGDVVSTSTSGDEPLGTIAGKGYSSYKDERSNNPVIHFEAKEPCVVMCVFSVMPELRYTQRGYDRLLSWNYVHDWPHPESDNLGMQPLFWYQLWAKMTATDAEIAPSDIFDWQYGYSEIKAKHNRVFGNVHNDGTLKSWVPQFDIYESFTTNFTPETIYYGDPMWLNNALVYKYMYENILDKTGYRGINYTKLYSRDPFIVSADFNCTKSSKLSKYSLVNL